MFRARVHLMQITAPLRPPAQQNRLATKFRVKRNSRLPHYWVRLRSKGRWVPQMSNELEGDCTYPVRSSNSSWSLESITPDFTATSGFIEVGDSNASNSLTSLRSTVYEGQTSRIARGPFLRRWSTRGFLPANLHNYSRCPGAVRGRSNTHIRHWND